MSDIKYCTCLKFGGAINTMGSVSWCWTPEEKELLASKYPTCGSDIPELRLRHTASAIVVMAGKLGIKCDENLFKSRVFSSRKITGETITYNGVTYPSMATACKAAGISCGSIYHAKKDKRLSPQEAFDKALASRHKKTERYGFLPMVIDGKSCNTIDDVAESLGVRVSVLRARSVRSGCSLEEAVYYYLNDGGVMRMRGESDVGSVSYAYTTDDNTHYYFVLCKICHSVILLPRVEVRRFTHGSICITQEVPHGMIINHTITGALKGLGLPCPYRCFDYSSSSFPSDFSGQVTV